VLGTPVPASQHHYRPARRTRTATRTQAGRSPPGRPVLAALVSVRGQRGRLLLHRPCPGHWRSGHPAGTGRTVRHRAVRSRGPRPQRTITCSASASSAACSPGQPATATRARSTPSGTKPAR